MSRLGCKALAVCLVISVWGGGCTEAAPEGSGRWDVGDQHQGSADAGGEDTAQTDTRLSDTGEDEDSGAHKQPDAASDPDTTSDLEDATESDGGVSLDAVTDPDADVNTGGGTIAIYLAGDLSEKTFDDELSGQTVKEFEVALSEYDIQTSSSGASWVDCFELPNPKVANVLQDNLMGTCPTASIPTGDYTHGRVKVDWLRLTVDGKLHFSGQHLPGEFTFFRAYSDTSYGGESFDAGEGWVEFRGAITQRVPAPNDDTSLDWGGVHSEVIDGEYWLTFPFERTLPVAQGNTQQHWSRFNWELFESFRWQDRMRVGYEDGVWDVSPTSSSGGEQVFLNGVSGFYITSSID